MENFRIDVEFMDGYGATRLETKEVGKHYVAHVSEEQVKKYHGKELWPVVAHEIGHAIAKCFNLPEEEEFQKLSFADMAVGMVPREMEAWRVAFEMFHIRRNCLKDYRNYVREKKRMKYIFTGA